MEVPLPPPFCVSAKGARFFLAETKGAFRKRGHREQKGNRKVLSGIQNETEENMVPGKSAEAGRGSEGGR